MAAKSSIPQRRLGLRASDYHFDHLLKSAPPSKLEAKDTKPRPPTPDDFRAPPIDLSDDEPQAATRLSSELSGIDSDSDSPPSPVKKRKIGRTSVKIRVPKSGSASNSSSPHSERTLTGCYIEPSNIKHSTFTAQDKHKQQTGSFANSQVKNEDPDEHDLFGSLTSSQGRVRKTYKNIHGSALSPKKTKNVKKESPTYAKQNNGGFKVLNTDALFAQIDEGTTKSKDSGWQDPKKLIKGESVRQGSRRSSRNSKAHGDLDNQFQPPPKTSPCAKSADDEKISDFRAPSKLPDESTAGLFKSPPITIPLSFGISDAARKIIAKLSETALPDSSGADSSTLSLSNEVASSTSSLSSPPSSPDLNASSEHRSFVTSPVPEYHLPSPKAQCPVCKHSVLPALLSSFIDAHTLGKSGDRLSVRQQALFCRQHRAQTAIATWNSRGYPIIDWSNFHARLERHHDSINEVLDGRKNSFYRNSLEEKVKTGKNRTAVQSMMSSGVASSETGYYGSKGAKAMMDYLVTSFSRPLRRLAKTDKLIVASGGVSAFVQAVLVPELTVSLVKEDMRVDDEAARQIIRESSKLGELVNEEEEEVVTLRDENEGDSDEE